MEIKWSEPGKDEIELTLEMSEDSIQGVKYRCSGSLSFMNFSKEQIRNLKGPTKDLVAPEGNQPFEIIWRELILTIKGQWEFPLKHDEVCHCRRVLGKTIDRAIVYGAHSAEEVRKRTSANTGCGTCLPDIKTLLELRL